MYDLRKQLVMKVIDISFSNYIEVSDDFFLSLISWLALLGGVTSRRKFVTKKECWLENDKLRTKVMNPGADTYYIICKLIKLILDGVPS